MNVKEQNFSFSRAGFFCLSGADDNFNDVILLNEYCHCILFCSSMLDLNQ